MYEKRESERERDPVGIKVEHYSAANRPDACPILGHPMELLFATALSSSSLRVLKELD